MTNAAEETTRNNAVRVNLLVLGASREPVDVFFNTICSPLLQGGNGLLLGGVPVEISALAGRPKEHADWNAQVSAAGAILIPVEHVDALSMQGVMDVYDALIAQSLSSPMAFFIVRESGHREFKASCLKCGQKIMLRDEYVGRGCTCPNCRKTFTIVSEKMALRQQLRLPMNVQVEQVDGASTDFTRGAIERLVERATAVPGTTTPGNQEALKHSTMRINLSDLAQSS